MNVTTEPALTPTHSPDRLPKELVESTMFLLKRLGFAAKGKSMAAFEATGLHPYQFGVLIALAEGSHETQGAIADSLGYDRGQLVGLLDELEERGLVERKRDPGDRRRQLVRLTPDGKRTLKELRALSKQLEDDFLEPLDAKDRAALHALLLRLAEKHEPRCAPLT
ncbi:MAG: MarR family transcriptional regulator [Actinobacteria bacterium]|nr:MAG: MarR family transcriptional regulator [Actinomycetota bacterium]